MTCRFGDGLIICSSSWGMGVTTLSRKDARDYEVNSIYGFGHENSNPYDFEPDRDSNSEQEIKNWEDAKILWNKTHEIEEDSEF